MKKKKIIQRNRLWPVAEIRVCLGTFWPRLLFWVTVCVLLLSDIPLFVLSFLIWAVTVRALWHWHWSGACSPATVGVKLFIPESVWLLCQSVCVCVCFWLWHKHTTLLFFTRTHAAVLSSPDNWSWAARVYAWLRGGVRVSPSDWPGRNGFHRVKGLD